jgi:nucleolar protein 56
MQTREEFFKRAKKKVTVAVSSRDNLLIQSVSAVDELNKSSNPLFERLTEWYGMHFPEFRMQDNAKYVEGVLAIDRMAPDMAKLTPVFGPQAQSIADKARASMGTALSEEDISQARSLALQIKALWQLRNSIEAYEAKIARELCPNMSHLAGPELAAKLVAQSGGLRRMAMFPASTVQVLGAEKALFKHLKSGSRPPKHGLIFQHPLIGMAPKKARGKISRALAAKLAIAAKADAFSHNFIAEKLKSQFEAQVKRIMGRPGIADAGKPGRDFQQRKG